MTRLQAFFSTPARQALGWTALGILGILMAAGGVWFLTDDGGSPKLADASDATLSPTATATATRTATALPTQTATATATPSPSPTATATATSRPFTGDSSGSSGGGNDDGASEPTATPTLPPIVAAGDYCSNDSSSSPPNSVIGIFTIGGAPAPAGSAVSLAFDGVVGPARLTTAAGGYRVDYFAGPEACANRVGASIAVVYGGQFYPTGHTVGDSPGAPVVVAVAAP